MNFSSMKLFSDKDIDEFYNIKFSVKHKHYREGDNSLLDMHFFYRKFFFLNDFMLQSSFESRNILPLNVRKGLLPHQRVQVEDFKGIKSYGIDKERLVDHGLRENSKEYFESVGFYNTYKWYNKLYYISESNNDSTDNKTPENSVFGVNPYFGKSKQRFLPYLHWNLMFVPQCKERTGEESATSTESSKGKNLGDLYFSAGLGLSYVSEYIALEAFYSGVVKKQTRDIGSSWGFNIGLD
eukprot:CAMPEP_0170519890 /NCGR_PEP_ID=MMETSP0209-20121228/5133_1 /TAXON_ID=665100 ORGANISM="Litonotus pictus, Strain P1" /NCGR_SAMPLE_ID=MMETSP0209 /ASSEMBLY_ACC=CAM_ASM_000301 /LENGTH=238 /DNA_ID=CAMNT_0010805877 /DNA_START=880 /DNA_END=1596 /DNA_ORIENTATION=+